MTAYWPWWSGALALFAGGVGYYRLFGRPFGVSGAWSRVIFARDQQKAAETEARMGPDPRALEAALIQATLEEFGPEAAAELEAEQRTAREAAAVPSPPPPLAPRRPWTESLALLLGKVLGGVLSAALGGGFAGSFDLGPDFARLFGTGWTGPAVLLVGGAMVGFGTQMAGGCTSGHGLSGCSRLQVGSLIATAVFFGAAVGTAVALEHVVR